MSRLSEVVLNPDRTCEDLRESFSLPDLPLAQNPAEIGLDYQEHWVLTPDAAVLRVWYLPARLNRGTVVVSMGSAGRMACYLFPPRLLVNNGWSVFIYEYRGFGLSTGVPSLAALPVDLETVVEWARAVTGREQVTLMGISLGSIPSIAVSVRRPDAINGVILDSPVALTAEIERFKFLIGGRADQLIDRIEPDLISEEIIARMQQPLLVFLNEADRVTPPSSIELLFERAAGPKQLVRFPNLDHALAPYVDTPIYTLSLEVFLSGVWHHRARSAAGN